MAESGTTTDAGDGHGLRPPRLHLATIASCLGTALVVIDGAIATVALPTIGRDLHVDSSATILIVSIYQLVLVMTMLPLSALGDRVGLTRLYQWGQILFTVATFLCFFATSLPFLLAVRALQGLGAAAVLAVMSALIRAIYPASRLGRGLALNGVTVSIASALAPTAGGLILSIAPWPWVFAAATPLAVLSLWLGWRSLPAIPPVPGRYNLKGAILNIAAFGLAISGLEAIVQGLDTAMSFVAIAVGVASFAVLIRRERGEPAPVLPVDLLRQPALALSIVSAFVSFLALTMLTLSLPFRLQHSYGLSPREVGAMIAPMPLGMMVVSPIAGVLSDRYRAEILGGCGMFVATLALLLLALLPAHITYFGIAGRMALCGAGFGLFFSPNARQILDVAPRARTASAGGLLSTTRLTGQTLGATAVAALLALGLGTSTAPGLIASALAALAGLCCLVRPRGAGPEPHAPDADAEQALLDAEAALVV